MTKYFEALLNMFIINSHMLGRFILRSILNFSSFLASLVSYVFFWANEELVVINVNI